MKTILVDAADTFTVEGEIDRALYELLEQYPNKKIILTNANDEQMPQYGLVDLPYELFTLKHHPDKVDPVYFQTMLKYFNLSADDVVYFEHNLDAVKSAESVGIPSYHFDHEKRDLVALKTFLDKNL